MGYPVPSIYDYKLIARIGSAPLTAAQMVEHLKLDPDLLGEPTFVAYMDALIAAAINVGEKVSKRVFWQGNFKAYLDFFVTCAGYPRGLYRGLNIGQDQPYEIRRSPLVSITSITRKVQDTPETIDAADYYFTPSETDFSYVAPSRGKSWPSDADDVLHAIEFDFVAGWTDANLPADILEALKLHVSAMFANRGDCDGAWSGSAAAACIGCPLPPGAKLIYSQHRIFDLRQGL